MREAQAREKSYCTWVISYYTFGELVGVLYSWEIGIVQLSKILLHFCFIKRLLHLSVRQRA